MELTLVLLKPDCYRKRLVGEVIGCLESHGLAIRGCKMFRFTEALLREHYGHHADKPFFPDLCAFMQSAPVIALALEGPEAIRRVRELVGPTDSAKAPKGTIRGDFGENKTINVVHASDSPESAEAELRRFFHSHELFLE